MSGASAEWSDAEVLKRMRREDSVAFREYFFRYRMLLGREARRLGVQAALREEVIDDCLGDVALELIEPDATLPLSLSAHLLGALRHRVWNERRGRRRRERRDAAAGEDAPATGERIVPATCSQAAMDASTSAEAPITQLAPAIERLALMLDRLLTEDERVLARWLGEWVPQTTIAKWLGISFGATRVRVYRLRERLRAAALKYVAGLNAAERRELDQLLGRRTPHSTRVGVPQTRSTPPPEPPNGGRAA